MHRVPDDGKPKKGIEPLTCSLRVSRSTPELFWHNEGIIPYRVILCKGWDNLTSIGV